MSGKLKPITGALISGLIGVASATCYTEHSYVCASATSTIGYYSDYATSFPCSGYVYASSDWYDWAQDSANSGGYPLDESTYYYCTGPAKMEDCTTFEYRSICGLTYGPGHYRVDPNASPCP